MGTKFVDVPEGFEIVSQPQQSTSQYSDMPEGSQVISVPSKMSMGEAAFTTATNPLGFGDEIKAGIAAGVAKLFGGAATQNIDIGDLYREARTSERAKLEKARQDYPSMTGMIETPSNLGRGAIKGLEEVGSGMYQTAADFGADFSGAKAILSKIRPDLKNEIESLTPQEISSILGEKAAQDSKATEQEGLSYKTGRFAGKVAPFLGVGGASKAGLAVGGGLAGGSELMEDSGVGKRLGSAAFGAVVAPVVGTAVQKVAPAAQSLGIAAAQAPKKLLQKAFGVKPEAVKTFQELGIEPTLADVSNSAGLQNFIKDVPLAGKPITEALQKQVNDISGQIQNVAKVKPKTTAQTGLQIKKGAQDFVNLAEKRVSNLYDDLDKQVLNESQEMTSGKLSSAIDEWANLKEIERSIIGDIEINAKSAALNSQFAQKQLGFWRNRTLADSGKLTTMAANDAKDLNNLKKLINKKESEIANYEKYLSPQQLKSVLATGDVAIPTKNIANIIKDEQVQDIAAVGVGDTARVISRYKNIVDEAGNISYPRLKSFRSTIGAKLQSPSLLGDERTALKKIYGALSEDMKDSVALYGGIKGLQAFDKANAAFERKTNFIENTINPLLKAKTPEKIYKIATTGLKDGGTQTKRLMNILKPEQQEYVRASIVRNMGLAEKGAQSAEANVFSPQKFMAEYFTLKKNGTEKAIFTPEQVTAFNRLNKAVELTKNTEQAGQQKQIMQAIGLTSVGVSTGVAGLIPALRAARISANLMTNPKFINWLAITSQSTPKELPKHLNRLSAITAANPEIRDEVLEYLSGFGINDSEASEPTMSEDQIRSQLMSQREKEPLLMDGINIDEESKKIKKRYYRD